ncbi:hypothetical protein ACFZCX_49465 [Streptomyces canus]|uniref:hypothetical protein n=1 Tax=Streptomyces canus TaxID=58343 RepID=UPI0036E8F501
MKPTQRPTPPPAAKAAAKGPSKTSAAFQRGVPALAQYIAREGASTPVPRAHLEPVVINSQAEPVMVKLGIWYTNTKTRRDKLAPSSWPRYGSWA